MRENMRNNKINSYNKLEQLVTTELIHNLITYVCFKWRKKGLLGDKGIDK